MRKIYEVTAVRIVANDENGNEVVIDLPSVSGTAILASSQSEPSAFGDHVSARAGTYRPPTLRLLKPLVVRRKRDNEREYTVRGALGNVPPDFFDHLRPTNDETIIERLSRGYRKDLTKPQ